ARRLPAPMPWRDRAGNRRAVPALAQPDVYRLRRRAAGARAGAGQSAGTRLRRAFHRLDGPRADSRGREGIAGKLRRGLRGLRPRHAEVAVNMLALLRIPNVRLLVIAQALGMSASSFGALLG